MPKQKIVPKSEKSLKPTARVIDFNNIYIRQAIRDLLDTLKAKQADLDKESPGRGGGVGLAANQIEYPYEPVSEYDDSPKEGFYPKDFVPPNIYVVSVRQERAVLEGCEMVEPSVYINASFEPLLDNEGYKKSSYKEGCLSVTGFTGFNIPRYENIRVKACNENGEELNFVIHGFVARVHQHEMDHGLGKEYLNQLDFDEAELCDILIWIEKHQNDTTSEISEWVIPNKLQCTSDVSTAPDFLALQTWVNNELLNMQENRSVCKK
ncbi:MAG: peptide deformylase [Proteobacteria bacterium]|nr:peptide deformylase [Pseudomonadota bacterium]